MTSPPTYRVTRHLAGWSNASEFLGVRASLRSARILADRHISYGQFARVTKRDADGTETVVYVAR